MQAVEVSGDNVDGDFDGVTNELTIGDITALTVYMAAQPRPTTLLELNALGLLEPALTNTQVNRIARGRQVFGEVGCASCHIPQLTLNYARLQRTQPERRPIVTARRSRPVSPPPTSSIRAIRSPSI